MSPDETLVATSATPKNKGGRPKGSRNKHPRTPKAMGAKPVHQAQRRKDDDSFAGPCRRIKILSNGTANPQFPEVLPITLGTLPRVWIRANQEVIVPEEIVSVLRDTTVTILAPGTYEVGKDRPEEYFVRIPFQDLGSATWEEYEAFKRNDAKKELVAPKR